MITVLKERTFAVQKATIVGKITQIYCNYKEKKSQSFDYFASHLQVSKIFIGLNWGGEIPFPPKFCHIYMIKFGLFILYVRRSWVLSHADNTVLGTFVKEIDSFYPQGVLNLLRKTEPTDENNYKE